MVNSEPVKIGCIHFSFRAIYFVDRIKHRFGNDPSHLYNIPIKWRYAFFAVQQQNDDIRIFNGLAHLKSNCVGIFIPFRESTGIDKGKLKFVPARIPVMKVTGNSWKIIHQSIFAAGYTVEKSRFANIGPTNYRNDGFHNKFYREKTKQLFKKLSVFPNA